MTNNVVILLPFLPAGAVPRGAHLAQGSDRVGERGRPPRGRVSAQAHRGEGRGEKTLLVNAPRGRETPPDSVQ